MLNYIHYIKPNIYLKIFLKIHHYNQHLIRSLFSNHCYLNRSIGENVHLSSGVQYCSCHTPTITSKLQIRNSLPQVGVGLYAWLAFVFSCRT